MMNCQIKSLLASLAIHSGVICIVMAMSSSWALKSKDVVIIDLTLLDSGVSVSAGTETITKNSGSQLPKPKETLQKPMTVPESSQITRIVTVRENPAPASPSEPMGTVAVASSEGNVSRQGEERGGAGTALGAIRTGSGSAVGSPGGKGNSPDHIKTRYLSEQYEYIKELIQKNLVYPKRAQRMGWAGRVLVSFVVLEDGQVTSEKILNSSGYNLLDDNVIETIKKVAPFPKPPERAKLQISFSYGLH